MNDSNVDFKIIVPLEKSEHEDGKWYIKGVATCIEPDKENDALTPEAIRKLAEQINSEAIPLRNHHKVDDILEDIGQVYTARILPDYSLEVEAELDQDHPGAQYLWKKLTKGKQYGMSLKGNSMGWYYDVDRNTGRRVRRHPSVHAGEISVTTRPVSPQTFGTVLQKAIDGDEPPAMPMGEAKDMSEETINGVAETATTESSGPENDTVVVEKALSPSDELVKSLMANEGFITLIKSTVSEALSETTTSVEDSTEISKSETETPDIAEIVKSAVTEVSAEFTAKLEALAERIPEVVAPALLIKSERDDADKAIAELRQDPRQALRVALAARHNELDRL